MCLHSITFALHLAIIGFYFKVMDIFLMTVRILGVVAEMKEMKERLLG